MNKNKIRKEFKAMETAKDKGVNSTDLLCNELEKSINYEPGEDDSNLYIFIRTVYRDFEKPLGLCLRIDSDKLNNFYIKQQLNYLSECIIRTFIEKNIISE